MQICNVLLLLNQKLDDTSECKIYTTSNKITQITFYESLHKALSEKKGSNLKKSNKNKNIRYILKENTNLCV